MLHGPAFGSGRARVSAHSQWLTVHALNLHIAGCVRGMSRASKRKAAAEPTLQDTPPASPVATRRAGNTDDDEETVHVQQVAIDTGADAEYEEPEGGYPSDREEDAPGGLDDAGITQDEDPEHEEATLEDMEAQLSGEFEAVPAPGTAALLQRIPRVQYGSGGP